MQTAASETVEAEPSALLRIDEVEDAYAYVTEHIAFGLPQGLAFLHPKADVTVGAAQYYLTGVSAPGETLLLNGEEITRRGANGSFAVSVPLEAGENRFVLTQGSSEAAVTITRDVSEDGLAQTDKITKMQPEGNYALKSGETYTLQCVAPAGATVLARIGEEEIAMKQVAVATAGVPARFTGSFTPAAAEGTQIIGNITYLMDGKSYVSEGVLYVVGENSPFVVEVQNASSGVFIKDSIYSGVLTTGKSGALDEVVAFGGDSDSGEMYQLRMGGWVQAAAVVPVEEKTETDHVVSQTDFTVDGRYERFVMQGTSRPLYQATETETALEITFFHTSGIKLPSIGDSQIFTDAKAVQKDTDTVLTLTYRGGSAALWGYAVEYEGTTTTLTLVARPTLAPGDTPLTGITVAIDAGHGGTDTGTLGLSYSEKPMEKDVALATAEALEKQLGLLGARVIMVRKGDENPTMNARMERAREGLADFYVSLHANSAGYTSDVLDAKGLEVYYFEERAKGFATLAAEKITAATGRVNRGAKQDFYRVTMMSFAPSIMVEMGFLPNPADFDSMCSPQGIYDTGVAISEAIQEIVASGSAAVPEASGA